MKDLYRMAVPDVGVLVEEQIRRWQLKRSHTQPSSPAVWPVITISREFGTSGIVVGRSLAGRLGFTCWGREIVTEIARRLRTDEATVRIFDEHPHTAIDDLFGLTFSQDAVSADYGDQLGFIVRSIALRGGAVIVGRGAQYLLDEQSGLRVRLVAPFELRVRQVEQRLQLSPAEAARRVREGDRDRAHFLRQYFHKDGTDPVDYDVVVNAGIFPPDRAEALVLAAYRAKVGRLPPIVVEADEESTISRLALQPAL
jgi:cytidylate kinase